MSTWIAIALIVMFNALLLLGAWIFLGLASGLIVLSLQRRAAKRRWQKSQLKRQSSIRDHLHDEDMETVPARMAGTENREEHPAIGS